MPSPAFVHSSLPLIVKSNGLGSHLATQHAWQTRRTIQTQFAVRFTAQLQVNPTEMRPQTIVDSAKKWDGMTLAFVSRTVAIEGRSSVQLRIHIEDMLTVEGDPVRWAITEVDNLQGTCQVDAVVSRYHHVAE